MRTWTKLGVAAAAALVVAAAPAAADTITFDFTASGGVTSGSGLTLTRTYTSGDVTVTASGWGVGTSSSATFAQGQVGQWNGAGLGVCNAGEGAGCGSPSHQVDNSGRYDFVLFQFDPAVTINSITVRTFNSADTDVSYFYGNASNPLSLVGKKISELTAAGLDNSGTDQGPSGSGAENVVTLDAGVYNSLLIGAEIGESNDAFKVRSLVIDFTETPTTPTVDIPEPLSLALFGTGLLGLGIARRRQRG
jgi:hypothetical protein